MDRDRNNVSKLDARSLRRFPNLRKVSVPSSLRRFGNLRKGSGTLFRRRSYDIVSNVHEKSRRCQQKNQCVTNLVIKILKFSVVSSQTGSSSLRLLCSGRGVFPKDGLSQKWFLQWVLSGGGWKRLQISQISVLTIQATSSKDFSGRNAS